jgi:hypothetical protein
MKEYKNHVDDARRQAQDHGGAQSGFECTDTSRQLEGLGRGVRTFLRGRTGVGVLEFHHIR